VDFELTCADCDCRSLTATASVFVGRTVELAQVSELVAQVRRGRAGGLCVLGEAGIGKTRLLDEAAKVATERGVRVARAGCLPLTTVLPFDPALELLRLLGMPVGSALLGGSPRELFGVLIERLERASESGPLLLCLDDLQWSDSATVDLVHYCLARLGDLPLAWLLVARSGRSSARLVGRFERDGLVDRVELGPMSAAETRLLTEALLGCVGVTDDVLDVVCRRTGGNPFLCVELLRTVLRHGRIDNGLTDGLRASIDGVVPATVSEALEERLDRLSPVTRAALDWAAVLWERFTFDELEAVAGAGAGIAPEDLADAGFLVDEGEGRWSFAHALIQDAVYRRLPEAERVRRHSVVVDVLVGMPLERAAPQLERARRFLEAAKATAGLAERSLNRGQGQDAAKLYEQSADLASAAGDGLLRRGAEAGRVLALVRAGARDEARREGSALRSEMRDSDDREGRLRFLSRYAMALMVVHDPGCIKAAGEILAEAEPLIAKAHGHVLAEALSTRAWLSLRIGESTFGLADAERAAELACSYDDAELEASALHALGLAIGLTRSAPQGVAVLKRAFERALAGDVPLQAARACMSLAFLAEQAGDIAAMEAHSRRGLEFDGAPASLSTMHYSNLGVARALAGDLDGALAHHLAAQHHAMRGGPLTRTGAAAALAYTHLYRGELAEARALLQRNDLVVGDTDDQRAPELWGLLLEEEDDPAAALVNYQEGVSADNPNSIWCEAGVARTAVAIDHLPVAKAALVRMDELVRRWPVGVWLQEESRGWVASAEGCSDDAIRHFGAAADQCTQAYGAVRLRLEAGRLAGDRDAVRGAITAFEVMGATRAGDRARAVARSLGMRPGRRHHRSGVLSAREQQVAQSVAAGHTNAEIATMLYLSPRTIERHIGNILTKLNYRSRVQIAAEVAAGRLPGAAG
jgi:DNA-binding CsgD family transcriptional regulator